MAVVPAAPGRAPDDAPPLFDGDRLRRAHGRQAAAYGHYDFLAREVSRRMAERLDFVRLQPDCILDLGCGPGADLPVLQARYPEALVFGADHALPMLQAGRRAGHLPDPQAEGWLRRLLNRPRRQGGILGLVADAEALPFASGSVDLVWSNLCLQDIGDPRPLFAQLHRILRGGGAGPAATSAEVADSGLLMFATLGPDSFKELKRAFRDGYAHVHPFPDMHDLGDMLVHAGFADPVMDMETLTLNYGDAQTLVQELRGGGGCCALPDRRRGLAGRAYWSRLADTLPRVNDSIPLTVEVVYGHAWRGVSRKAADGRDIVRFSPRRPG